MGVGRRNKTGWKKLCLLGRILEDWRKNYVHNCPKRKIYKIKNSSRKTDWKMHIHEDLCFWLVWPGCVALHQRGPWALLSLELQHGGAQALSVLFHWHLPQLEISRIGSSVRGGSGKGRDAGDGQTPLTWLHLQLLQSCPWGHLSLMVKKLWHHGRAGLCGDTFCRTGMFWGDAGLWGPNLAAASAFQYVLSMAKFYCWLGGFLMFFLSNSPFCLFPEYPWCRLSCNTKPLPN